MTDPVTRLLISHTHSFSVIWMIMLAYLSLLLLCTFTRTSSFTVVVRGLPPFQRFPHEPLWLTPDLDPLSSIRRCILGTGLRCALEFRVVEFSRVSDPLRRIQYL